jgi:hypothetical protein
LQFSAHGIYGFDSILFGLALTLEETSEFSYTGSGVILSSVQYSPFRPASKAATPKHDGLSCLSSSFHSNLCKTQQATLALASTLLKLGIQAQKVRQSLPMFFGGASESMFPLPHCYCWDAQFLSHF